MPVHHLVIADCVEVTHRMANNTGKTWRVVTHHNCGPTQAVNAAMADAIFASVKALWVTNLAPRTPLAVSYMGVDVRDLRGPGFALVSSTGAVAAGTDATGEQLPLSVSACLTLRTNRAGRSYRGRMYWGGFSELANGPGGVMTAVAKTAIDAFAAGFISAANVNSTILSVAHRPTAFDEITGLPVSPGLGFLTPVSGVVCRDTIWDSQRRRAQ